MTRIARMDFEEDFGNRGLGGLRERAPILQEALAGAFGESARSASSRVKKMKQAAFLALIWSPGKRIGTPRCVVLVNRSRLPKGRAR